MANEKQFYGRFDSDGRPLGFYVSDVHGVQGEEGSAVPAEAIPITEDEWQEMLSNQGQSAFIDGRVVVTEPMQPKPADEPLRNAFDEIDALTARVAALEAAQP